MKMMMKTQTHKKIIWMKLIQVNQETCYKIHVCGQLNHQRQTATITRHVDDIKSSHEDNKVNDEFLDWLKDKYANNNIGEVKAKRVPSTIIWE